MEFYVILSMGVLAIAQMPASNRLMGRRDAEGGAGAAKSCPPDQKAELVKCFIYLLDDWAWNLWEMKKNMASLNCTIHAQMNQCMTKTQCSLQEAYQVSSALSELLTYSRGQDTFLHSFLAMEFTCDPEGAAIVAQNSECLQKFHEGMHILMEIDDLQDQIMRNPASTEPAKLCETLKERAEFMKTKVRKECDSENLAYLVCKTVVNPFVRINETVFASCKDSLCPKPPPGADPGALSQGGGLMERPASWIYFSIIGVLTFL